MADVLDCVCIFHIIRDIYGYTAVMVPILLRNKSDCGAVAAVAGHRRQLGAVSELRASNAHQWRTGNFVFRLIHQLLLSHFVDGVLIWQGINEYINHVKEKGCMVMLMLEIRPERIKNATNTIMQTAPKVGQVSTCCTYSLIFP